jgi:hypothetical protein
VLRATSLPFSIDGAQWTICPLSGSLLRRPVPSGGKLGIFKPFPDLVKVALSHCDFPYSLNPFLLGDQTVGSVAPNGFANQVWATTTWLSERGWFLLTRIYSGIYAPCFDSSAAAFRWLDAHSGTSSSVDCLPRCMFVAKTSKSFRQQGVLFVGVFLPTRQMHSWIIDGASQPDSTDRHWINYRPLLALYFSK